jgi:hypothetical protein
MTKDLVEYKTPALIPSDHEMAVFQVMATQAVESKMYRGIGDKAGVMMIMLSARELGIPPVTALNGGINIIQGKVELSARMMNALMRKAGINIEVKESTDERCTLVGHRGFATTVSYSLEEARRAGLVKPGGGWAKNPKDMCFARAISRLARQIAPDLIGGCYVEGEISGALPESAHAEEPIIVEDVKPLDITLSDISKDIPEEEKDLFSQYFEVCRAHFDWTYDEELIKFSKEPKLMEKFESWKSKRKKTENSESTNP